MNKIERHILWNQYEILKNLDEENYDYYNEYQNIISNGYTLYYDSISQHIYDDCDTMSKQECIEVQNALNVCAIIVYSLKDLGATIDSPWTEYRGYDGNNESKFMSFANFLLDVQKKWEELKHCPRNSHMPARGKYCRMVSAWEKMGRPVDLSLEMIKTIVNA